MSTEKWDGSQLFSELNHALNRPDSDYHVEVTILVTVACVGIVANLATLLFVLALPKLRRASNAFVCHHCLLDLIKSAYCLPFAQSLVVQQDTLWCGILGGSYIVFVTSSSFNLLAMVMNEAYHFADLTMNIKDSRNYCCVIFGVFTIWFGSVIMNLGVAVIPGNPSFNREQGHCVFVYGVTQNYVLHILWVVLISLAICLTIGYLHKLHMDIKKVGYYRLSTLVRTTFQINPSETTPQQEEETRDRNHIAYVQHITRKKLFIMVLNTTLFIAFWYPLFTLSISDPHSRHPPNVYKALTMLAWSYSTFSPILLIFFVRVDICCECLLRREERTPIYNEDTRAEGQAIREHLFSSDTVENGQGDTPHTAEPGWITV